MTENIITRRAHLSLMPLGASRRPRCFLWETGVLGNDELEIEKRPAPVREWLVTGWGAAK